jgi:voltage-gated potassium channel
MTLARRSLYLLGALALVLAFGTCGYRFIEGWPWFDSFYMTLYTVTTVGYAELRPLSRAGRIFNSFVILAGVTTVFFAIGLITQFAIQAELGQYFGKRRQKRMLDKIQDHYILCGVGRVGRSVIRELVRNDAAFVVVDTDQERVQWALEQGYVGVLADATQDETLLAVHIDRAKGLVAALPTDAENLYVVLTARGLNKELTIVSRATDEPAADKLRRAGANTVLTPYAFTGHRLAQAMLRPHVVSFLDMASAFQGSELDLEIEQIKVGENSACACRTLEQARLPQQFGIIVLAIVKGGGQMLFNPSAQTVISPGDVLIAMGESSKLWQVEEQLTGVHG